MEGRGRRTMITITTEEVAWSRVRIDTVRPVTFDFAQSETYAVVRFRDSNAAGGWNRA